VPKRLGVGVNMGTYNGFLGVALLWSALALNSRQAYSVNNFIALNHVARREPSEKTPAG
jgi:uncharacterized membrane protein